MAQQCAVVAARLSFGHPSPRLVTAWRQTARYLKPNPAIAIHERCFNNIFNKPIFNGVSKIFLKGWHEKSFANDFQMNFKPIFNKPIFNGVSKKLSQRLAWKSFRK